MAGKKKQDDGEVSSRRLRTEAEKKVALTAGKSDLLKKRDLDKLVHELQIHQVELEMQNEELRRTQEELQASREQYFELYDIAPVGYFSLSEAGIILEANLTGANMLGCYRAICAESGFRARFLKLTRTSTIVIGSNFLPPGRRRRMR